MNDEMRQIVMDLAEEAVLLEARAVSLRQKLSQLELRIASERGAPAHGGLDTRLLADLGLSKRCLNSLARTGATHVFHVDRLPDAELRKLANFGDATVSEFRSAIGRPKKPFLTLIYEPDKGHWNYRLPKAAMELPE